MELQFVAGTTFVKKIVLSSLDISDLTDVAVYLEARGRLSDAAPFISINSEAPNEKGSVINVDIAENSIELVFTSLETVNLASFGKDLNYFWDLRFVFDDDTVKVLYPASTLTIQKVSTRIGKDLA